MVLEVFEIRWPHAKKHKCENGAMVIHLVRPGADMGMSEVLLCSHYTKGLNSQGPCCSAGGYGSEEAGCGNGQM
mgnify:CR=1 FL=1